MHRKPKFSPQVTRIKLNPEQAVLYCACFQYGRQSGTRTARASTCNIQSLGKRVSSLRVTTGASLS